MCIRRVVDFIGTALLYINVGSATRVDLLLFSRLIPRQATSTTALGAEAKMR
jgi:hypothetical protein